MARIAVKFGGTSVADTGRIKAVAARIAALVAAGDEIAVIVSAMAGRTDQLVGWTHEMGGDFDAREHDVGRCR